MADKVELRITTPQAALLRASLLRIKASMTHFERMTEEGQAVDGLLALIDRQAAHPETRATFPDIGGEVVEVYQNFEIHRAVVRFGLDEVDALDVNAEALIEFLAAIDPGISDIEVVWGDCNLCLWLRKLRPGWARLDYRPQDAIMKPTRRKLIFRATAGSRVAGMRR